MIFVEEIGVTTAALDPPNLTALALARFVPVIVTTVPPSVGPDAGLMPVTVGGAAYVYWSAALVALVPPAVVTVDVDRSRRAGRAVATICVAL